MAFYAASSGLWGLICLIFIISSAAFIGGISVTVALARGEKLWPFTLLGIILNGGLLFIFFVKFVR